MTSDDRLSNRHFLVVDDEAFICRTVRRYLVQSGAAGVQEADNGQTAIDKLLRHDMVFDCVITDFEMRPMNGLELLKAIRTGANGLKRNTPVLMLTTHALPQLVAAALALDADGFVAKPISREMLVDRIYRVIRRRVPIRDALEYRDSPVFETPPPSEPGQPSPLPPNEAVIIDRPEEKPPESESDKRRRPQTVIPALGKSSAARPNANAFRTNAKPSEAAASSSRASLVASAISIPLAEVRPNSILAQNIYGSDHKTLLVGMETVLTAALLNRLKDLQALHSSFDKLLVVEPSSDQA